MESKHCKWRKLKGYHTITLWHYNDVTQMERFHVSEFISINVTIGDFKYVIYS